MEKLLAHEMEKQLAFVWVHEMEKQLAFVWVHEMEEQLAFVWVLRKGTLWEHK